MDIREYVNFAVYINTVSPQVSKLALHSFLVIKGD